ncbi:MAG: lantibiotic dehydratase [Saprospiraceae bacterium]|nr:lantibiotic dehydratase [Saprospiraceae bacterium]
MKFDYSEIEILDKVVVRTPSFPLSELDFDDLNIEKMMANDFFCKALYIANSKVYEEAAAYIQGNRRGAKRDRRLKKTLSNYYIRIHRKSVPFGFFANVFTGTWGEKSKITLTPPKPKIRFDMEVVSMFINKVNKDADIQKIVMHYPNNTLYGSGEKLRYNEIYFENEAMKYKLSEVEINEYLVEILAFTEDGKTLEETAKHVHQGVYAFEDILEFVTSLVDEQILLSELQLNITGIDPLTALIKRLSELYDLHPEVKSLGALLEEFISYAEKIASLEVAPNFIQEFEDFYKFVTNNGYTINSKSFLQVDCFSEAKECTINAEIKDRVYEAMKIVSAFKQNDVLPKLETFKKKFYERYENALVPLLEVLDTDSGISFGHFVYQNENIFTSELAFKPKSETTNNSVDSLNRIKILLYNKYVESIKEEKSCIEIFDKDLEAIDDKIKDLSTTFQVVLHHCEKSTDTVFLYTVGNSCAGNLISRFTHGSKKISNALFEIAEFEKESYEGAAVAEIVHIPEYRIGNISFRPRFRDYEIPIVTRSRNPVDKQIQLKDIYVTVSGNRIVLVSKKLRKEIVPKLTNAHNYGLKTLPVYQFLSELSYQNVIPDIQVYTGVLDYLGKYIPRVQYKNVILSLAQWTLDISDLDILFKEDVSTEDLKTFTSTWKLPRYTIYQANAKTTLMDWTSLCSLQRLLKVINKNAKVFLYEFPYDAKDGLIQDINNGVYNNELICFVKNKARTNYIYKSNLSALDFEGERSHFAGGKWIYLKVYMGYKAYHRFMTTHMPQIQKLMGSIDEAKKFFFLPFTDPEFHIRLRVEVEDTEIKHKLLNKLLDVFQSLKEEYSIHKIVQDTYKQEIERYGKDTIGFGEELFALDSQFFTDNFNDIFIQDPFFLPFKVMKSIDVILEGFELEPETKKKFLSYIQNIYANEFGVDEKNDSRSQLEGTLRKNRQTIESYLNPENETKHFSPELIEGFNRYRTFINTAYLENKSSFNSKGEMLEFLRSILHMHCIRAFITTPRQNELFIYTALTEYYTAMIYRQKVEA